MGFLCAQDLNTSKTHIFRYHESQRSFYGRLGPSHFQVQHLVVLNMIKTDVQITVHGSHRPVDFKVAEVVYTYYTQNAETSWIELPRSQWMC